MIRAAALLVAVWACGFGCTAAPEFVPPELGGMEPQVAELISDRLQAARAEPGSAARWGELGTVCDAHGLLEPAESAYRRAVHLAPDRFEWTYLLAVVREVRGAGADELLDRFEAAARLNPDYMPVWARLGDALSVRGRLDPARKAYERSIELAPGSAAAHRGLGQVLLGAGRPADALDPLRRAVELEPRDKAAFAALARAYRRLGNEPRAAEARARAEGLSPIHAMDDPVYGRLVYSRSVSSSRLFSRAVSRIRDGAFEGAIEDLGVVARVRPQDASVSYWLGLAYARAGRNAEGLVHLGRAVELQGGLVAARVELARLLAAGGRDADAHEQLAALERIAPQHPQVNRLRDELKSVRPARPDR